MGIELKWFERFPHAPQKMYVPACWNNELFLCDYEGVAWYRRTVRMEQTGHVRLLLHAVLGHADVYLDVLTR
ncbi:hypothetical protein [Paenibacillus puerhi]|uniref:hypothetical protein n=1 Tax=Paenibacillus puerhi TaxID=2692622 RepID=UPI00135873E8|nr:hypothetical protein [Paenibacillus puerhi]